MFNFLGSIGRILPGYTEGHRQAIQDNWQDLNQYSDVQAKQIQNLFAEQTFQPLVNMQYDEAAKSQYQLQQAGRMNALERELFPWRWQAAKIAGYFEPLKAAQAGVASGMLGYAGLGGGYGGYGDLDYVMQGGLYGNQPRRIGGPSLLGIKR